MNIVSLSKCNSYKLEEVKQSIQKNITDLGGLEKYISKGEKVLLKINLVSKKKPNEAGTTHPTFIQALAEILIDYGAQVVIGDSPGGMFNKNTLLSTYKYCEIDRFCNDENPTLNLNCDSFTKTNEKGLILKSLEMTDYLNDVDKVISVSKLKTHVMMTFTGAVKNMFGTIPGIKKAEYHLNMPEYKDFSNALVDICLAADPVLSFMDGIVGMEGDGPTSGDPININVTLASTSPYHLDKVACNIINLDINTVPTIARCIERGICTNDLSDVTILGNNINEFKINNYKIPKPKQILPKKYLPNFVLSFLNKHVQQRPVFNKDLCISCEICKNNCPANVITMVDGLPTVQLDKCIRCYCCHELCPKKAVSIYKPTLGGFL